jgi:hypothetical protein
VPSGVDLSVSMVFMDKDDKPRAPRFRIVLEASFEDLDPCDPSGYSEMLSRWAESLGRNPVFGCKDVRTRELMTIGDKDDYSDWRYHRGIYDASSWGSEGIRFNPGREDDKTDS